MFESISYSLPVVRGVDAMVTGRRVTYREPARGTSLIMSTWVGEVPFDKVDGRNEQGDCAWDRSWIDDIKKSLIRVSECVRKNLMRIQNLTR